MHHKDGDVLARVVRLPDMDRLDRFFLFLVMLACFSGVPGRLTLAAASEAEILSEINADIERGVTMKAFARLRSLEREPPALRDSSGISAFRRAVYSWVGLYGEALAEADRGTAARVDSGSNPIENLKPDDAVESVTRLARGSRLVMINEAHHVPQHRAFAVQMLYALRKAGYTHFAAETLATGDAELSARGFPVTRTGFYSSEPLYGDLIRTALRLGYRVVAYESTGHRNAEEREEFQARNLLEQTFRLDPAAKVYVFAGHGHIDEFRPPNAMKTLAQRLSAATGINPLTVDQTRMSERSAPQYEFPAYRHAIDRVQIDKPFVLLAGTGAPWSDRPEWNDVVVFSPRTRYEQGRPQWLALGGKRHALKLASDICGDREQCLVSARHAKETVDAIPVDQLAITSASAPVQRLMLPRGKFTVSVTDTEGKLVRTFAAKL
jgi:hypothetical protein